MLKGSFLHKFLKFLELLELFKLVFITLISRSDWINIHTLFFRFTLFLILFFIRIHLLTQIIIQLWELNKLQILFVHPFLYHYVLLFLLLIHVLLSLSNLLVGVLLFWEFFGENIYLRRYFDKDFLEFIVGLIGFVLFVWDLLDFVKKLEDFKPSVIEDWI